MKTSSEVISILYTSGLKHDNMLKYMMLLLSAYVECMMMSFKLWRA